jgi:toxin HigB-1
MQAMAIQSFACADTKGLFTTGRNLRLSSIKKVAQRKLVQLDTAPSLPFLLATPGIDLTKYDGALHVRLNEQWRLTFKWGPSGPFDVVIDAPH